MRSRAGNLTAWFDRSGVAVPLSVLAASLAFAGAVVWVMRDAQSTEVGDVFVSTPEFILWLMVIAAQAAVWFVLLVPVTVKAGQQVGRLRKGGTKWLWSP